MIDELIEKTKQRILNLHIESEINVNIGQEILFLSQSINELQKHKDYAQKKFSAEHNADRIQREKIVSWRKH